MQKTALITTNQNITMNNLITAGVSRHSFRNFSTMQDAVAYVARHVVGSVAGGSWFVAHDVKTDGTWNNVAKMNGHNADDCATILKAKRHLQDVTRTS